MALNPKKISIKGIDQWNAPKVGKGGRHEINGNDFVVVNGRKIRVEKFLKDQTDKNLDRFGKSPAERLATLCKIRWEDTNGKAIRKIPVSKGLEDRVKIASMRTIHVNGKARREIGAVYNNKGVEINVDQEYYIRRPGEYLDDKFVVRGISREGENYIASGIMITRENPNPIPFKVNINKLHSSQRI